MAASIRMFGSEEVAGATASVTSAAALWAWFVTPWRRTTRRAARVFGVGHDEHGYLVARDVPAPGVVERACAAGSLAGASLDDPDTYAWLTGF